MVEAAARLDYYEAAAQVIPVLFILLAFGEARLIAIRSDAPPIIGTVFFLGVMMCLVLGEVVALRVLASGHDDLGLGFVVTGSLAFAFELIIFQVAFRHFDELGIEVSGAYGVLVSAVVGGVLFYGFYELLSSGV